MSRVLRSAAVTVLALAVTAPTAGAASIYKPPPKKQQFTYTSDKCNKQVDPLNIVFWGRAASASNSQKATEDVTGWGAGFVERGSTQYFIRGGSNCVEKNSQIGSGTNIPHDRFHLRFFEKRINRTRWATYADAHHDDFDSEGCTLGDAVSAPGGFNQGR